MTSPAGTTTRWSPMVTSALLSPWLMSVTNRRCPSARRTISRSRGQPPARLAAGGGDAGRAGQAGRLAGRGEQGGGGGGVGAGGHVPGPPVAELVPGDGGAAGRRAVGVPGDGLGPGQPHRLGPAVGPADVDGVALLAGQAGLIPAGAGLPGQPGPLARAQRQPLLDRHAEHVAQRPGMAAGVDPVPGVHDPGEAADDERPAAFDVTAQVRGRGRPWSGTATARRPARYRLRSASGCAKSAVSPARQDASYQARTRSR